MKAYRRKFIGATILGLALCANSIPARAGLAISKEVYISLSGDSVQGALTGARYSADGVQYLTCSSEGALTAATAFIECEAGDKRGKFFYCLSSDPRFVDAVKGMTDASDLYITKNRISGQCTNIEVTNESAYLK